MTAALRNDGTGAVAAVPQLDLSPIMQLLPQLHVSAMLQPLPQLRLFDVAAPVAVVVILFLFQNCFHCTGNKRSEILFIIT